MHQEAIRLDHTIAEYRSILDGHTIERDAIDAIAVECRLETDADWTAEGASHLVELARQYGAFMLRNACALAVALEIEDGSLGL